MGPFNLLLLCFLVITDAGSNWAIPKLCIVTGHQISGRFNLGEIGNMGLSGAALGIVSTIGLYILKCWLNFCAPEESPLHQHVLSIIYVVNILWIIGCVVYLFGDHGNNPGNFLETPIGFVIGVIIFILLKGIAYSNLKDYAPEEKINF